ncbi:MAG: hypothetical protein ABS938_00060 [Psychrobacillus psychrodurans]
MYKYQISKADIAVADKEYDSVMNNIVTIQIHLQKGNFGQALLVIKDIEKSLLVLKKLIEKNKVDSKVSNIVNQLRAIGVDASVIIKKS